MKKAIATAHTSEDTLCPRSIEVVEEPKFQNTKIMGVSWDLRGSPAVSWGSPGISWGPRGISWGLLGVRGVSWGMVGVCYGSGREFVQRGMAGRSSSTTKRLRKGLLGV